MITIQQKLLQCKREYEEETEANEKRRKKLIFQHVQRDMDIMIQASTTIYGLRFIRFLNDVQE